MAQLSRVAARAMTRHAGRAKFGGSGSHSSGGQGASGKTWRQAGKAEWDSQKDNFGTDFITTVISDEVDSRTGNQGGSPNSAGGAAARALRRVGEHLPGYAEHTMRQGAAHLQAAGLALPEAVAVMGMSVELMTISAMHSLAGVRALLPKDISDLMRSKEVDSLIRLRGLEGGQPQEMTEAQATEIVSTSNEQAMTSSTSSTTSTETSS